MLRDLRVGGAERQAVLLARHFHRHLGARIELWCFQRTGRNLSALTEAGIEVVELSPDGGSGPLTRSLSLLRFVRIARRRRPELLLPFTDYPNKVCCALWPLMGASAAVWNQRDEGRETTGRPLERRAVRRASLFVCNSESGELFLRRQFGVEPHRIERVPNGVVLEPARRTPHQWRTSLGLAAGQPLVVMVGNLHRFKDHGTLLRAWRRVLDRQPGRPVLALAGRADVMAEPLYTQAGELELGDGIRFLGQVDDVPGLLGVAQLVAHSSTREGCPNGILEPMAAGLPVVATDIEGAREALGEDCPFLVPAANPEALADAICRLLDDDQRRRQLGRANRERIDRLFSPEVVFPRYAEVVARLLAPG